MKTKKQEQVVDVTKVVFVTDIPEHCINDKEKLLFRKKAVVQYQKKFVELSGYVCPKCRTMYWLEFEKQRLMEALDKPAFPAPTGKILCENTKSAVASNQSRLNNTINCYPGDRALSHRPMTVVSIYRKKGNAFQIAIVSEHTDQNSDNGIYWKGREISQSVLRAIATRQEKFTYRGAEYIIEKYSKTKELNEYLQLFQNPIATGSSTVTVWIYSAKLPCPSHTDAVDGVTVFVPSVRGMGVNPLSVNYCNVCKKYYINSTSFNLYAKRYGMPYVRLKASVSEGQDFALWNEESILHFIGYNVGKTENLSEHERRGKLMYVIDAGILKKPQVTRFLEGLICRCEGRRGMEDAVQKWTDDLKFVLEYNIEHQRRTVGEFKKRN